VRSRPKVSRRGVVKRDFASAAVRLRRYRSVVQATLRREVRVKAERVEWDWVRDSASGGKNPRLHRALFLMNPGLMFPDERRLV
jgi:hypothetical protein